MTNGLLTLIFTYNYSANVYVVSFFIKMLSDHCRYVFSCVVELDMGHVRSKEGDSSVLRVARLDILGG